MLNKSRPLYYPLISFYEKRVFITLVILLRRYAARLILLLWKPCFGRLLGWNACIIYICRSALVGHYVPAYI